MSTEVGAYYYPLTRDCPIRQKRAKDLGVELVDETLLTQQAEPLFSGHEQPNVYCLGDENVTTWDDSDPAVFAKQIEIAQDYDLDFFVFDTYLGHKNGQFVQEANKPLDQNFLENKFGQNMKFALMLAMSSPRAIIPIPKKSGFEKPGRQYDIGPETAREIVDLCVEKYWNQNNYLTINGSPYLSLFASDFSADSQREADFRTLVNEILTYSHKEYGIDPYLVGVARKISAAKNLVAAGVSALTGYGFLADFGDKTNPIQEYKSLLEKRQQEWLEMKIKSGVPFVPPVVVGWDASPRGEAKLALEEVGVK